MTASRLRPRRKGPVLLKDDQRYRLLYGPYEPPVVKRGFLVDAIRGKLPFRTFSNALIPWPKAKRRGKSGSGGFIVCGDLIRALEKESVPAISHHWGISRATIGNWRRALGLKGTTEGAQRLVRLGVELARLPQSRKKISEAARGRVLSPATKSRLFAAIRRGWKKRFRARRAAYRQFGRFPKATKSDPWIPEEDKLLRKLSPRELAPIIGRSIHSIQGRRFLLNIRTGPPVVHRPWTEVELKHLGTDSDRRIAERLGRSTSSVMDKRRYLKIKGYINRSWTKREEAIIGKVSDAKAARRLGRTKKAIQHHRLLMGIKFFHVERRPPWTPSEEALLGTDTDAAIASKLGRTMRSIAIRRRKRNLAPVFSSFRPWTSEETASLGTMSDAALARRLNRSPSSVSTKRLALNIPPGTNRLWISSEYKMLGRISDEDAARRLRRTPEAVRVRRIALRIRKYSE